MNVQKFSLRERKYGDKRHEILMSFLEVLENELINNISVESICDKVQISKVTFFKYFHSKEEVLYYYIHKWQYNLSYDIYLKTYSGVDGILHTFKKVSDEKYAVNFMLAIIQYFIKLESCIETMNITEYEYFLFNKEGYQLGIEKFDLYQIFLYYLGDLNYEENRRNIVLENLVTAFYGVPITAVILGKREELFDMYRNSIMSFINNNGVKK